LFAKNEFIYFINNRIILFKIDTDKYITIVNSFITLNYLKNIF